MSLDDVTPALARRSGFVGLVALLKIAKYGPGRRVFLVEFRYAKPRRRRKSVAAYHVPELTVRLAALARAQRGPYGRPGPARPRHRPSA